eukprot:gene14176-14296_t
MQINRPGPIVSRKTGFGRLRPGGIAALMPVLALAGCDAPAPHAGERQPAHPVAVAQPQHVPPRAPAAPPRPVGTQSVTGQSVTGQSVTGQSVMSQPGTMQPGTMVPPADWRDAPLPPGDWSWTPRPGGSMARYGLAGHVPRAVLTCDRLAATVRLILPTEPRATPSAGVRTVRITASTTSGTATAEMQMEDGTPALVIALPASSRLLDAMAFSRGRFRIAIDGSGSTGPTATVLPSWSEVGRVVEDCRG